MFLYIHREDLRKWQLATLNLHQDVQRVFEEHQINGWCGGGTLIGAVRNGGFLYWDNDLDMFFMFKDCRRILLSFREVNLFEKYDIYFFRNNYWQKNDNLMDVLKAENLNHDLLEFELNELGKGMFKLFSKESIEVSLYNHDFKSPKEYVRLKHFAPIHFTRYRLAARDINIENGSKCKVLPEICMLPMLEMDCKEYLSFVYRHAAKSIISTIANVVDYPEAFIEKENAYTNIQHLNGKSKFEKGIFDSLYDKSILLANTLIKGTARSIKVSINKFIKNKSNKFIVYQPVFFRFRVLPFLKDDIFPLQKIRYENAFIYAPNNIHNVLSTQFGNYMRVPEIQDRIAYPFFIENQMHG